MIHGMDDVLQLLISEECVSNLTHKQRAAERLVSKSRELLVSVFIGASGRPIPVVSESDHLHTFPSEKTREKCHDVSGRN